MFPIKVFNNLVFRISYLCVILGLLCDILWSDPNKVKFGWHLNDRGVSYTFGADVVNKFLIKHDFDLICRGHQVNFNKFFIPYLFHKIKIAGGRRRL